MRKTGCLRCVHKAFRSVSFSHYIKKMKEVVTFFNAIVKSTHKYSVESVYFVWEYGN